MLEWNKSQLGQEPSCWRMNHYWSWTGSRWDWICHGTVHECLLMDLMDCARHHLEMECGLVARLHEDKLIYRQLWVWVNNGPWQLETTHYLTMSSPFNCDFS